MVTMTLFDIDATRAMLEEAVAHYAKLAPTVSRWADDLYVRLDRGQPVQVDEILQLQRLRDDFGWLHPNYAANAVYKLQSMLGQDTTGHAGY